MNYHLMPSLEHRALIKIATTVLNQDDIRALIANSYFSTCFQIKEIWQKIEDKVIEKVLELPLPESFKKNISAFIKPISLQMLKWKDEISYFSIGLPNELCWTPQGTVDKKRTIKVLIQNENLDITTRYKLACIYCLEDDILELFNKIPENHIDYCEDDPSNVRQHELVVVWTHDIRKGMNKHDIGSSFFLYQYAFKYAAVGGNKAATEYFFQKLTSKEREESLITSAGDVANRRCDSFHNRIDFPKNYADVLYFLLSQMDEEQQIEVFKSFPYEVLICLLDWPWQSLFMEMANRMWGFLPESSYDDLLREVICRVINGYKDCNYQQLFGEFWTQSPNAYKRYVLGERESGGFFLRELFKMEDEENVRLILKSATVKEKEVIIFHYKEDICERLISGNKWDSLKYFFQECISSKEVMIRFKDKFKYYRSLRTNRRHRRTEEELESEIWCKCFHLLDNLILKDDKKRNIEEGENNPAKRLRNA